MTATMIKAIAVLLSFLGMFGAEREWPADQRREDWSRIRRNLALGFVNFLLGPFIVVPITAYAASHAIGWRPDWWGLALDLLVLDLWIYFWHRANHLVPFLWRFHEVHHRDEMLDATSALRFHFGEVVLSAVVRGLVIFALTMPLQSVLIFETLVVLMAIFHHSNLWLPYAFEKALSKIVVTPSLHWVHHHAYRADTDSNYATVLSLWDVVFRSRSPHRREERMKLGVEDRYELPLLQLLLKPFRSDRSH